MPRLGRRPAPTAGGGTDRHVRINEVQMLASHNSYHLQPQQQLPTPCGRPSATP